VGYGFAGDEAPFSVATSPQARMLVDLGKSEARLAIATGQSGRQDSPHAADQVERFRSGELVELEPGKRPPGAVVELVPGG
jgi:acyl-homoserine lactone acylase PvdQ